MADFIMKRAGDSIDELGSLVLTCADEKPFSVEGVEISADIDEKGVMAAKKITKQDVLFSVDSSFFISEEVIDPVVADAIDKAVADIPGVDVFFLKMIIALFECKNAKSNSSSTEGVSPSNKVRAAYFDTLPRAFTHMPMNYTDEVLQSFGPSFPLALLTSKLKDQSQQAFEIFSNLEVLKNSQFSFPDAEFVNWASCCLNSRCFELKENKVRRCMVPFADLLNHSFNPTLIHEVDEKGTLVFRAARDIDKGEELTISYQTVNDACSYLLHYGFNPWSIEEDASSTTQDIQIYFHVTYPVDDIAEGTVLRQAIESLGLNASADMALPATLSQPMPPMWIWLLRLKGMSNAQRESFIRGQVEVSVMVESAAWQCIREQLNTSAAWYDAFVESSAEEESNDSAAADASKFSFEVPKLARSVRSNARRVIAAAISLLPPLTTS